MGQMTHPSGQAAGLWERWLERVAEQGIAAAFDGDFEQQAMRVWEASDYVAQSCLRDPVMLLELHESGLFARSYHPGEIASELSTLLLSVRDEPALHRLLRRFRRSQMVRIIWRDIGETAPLAETLEDLSALADACIDQTLSLLFGWAVQKQGAPRDSEGIQQHLVVLGMGKLGARELNLSSDIDLIFAYPRQGEVDGVRPVANEQFFTRLCQQLIKALNTTTADGFVFRVDARLRPFGDSGPLAMCFEAMETYYQSHAREWERYAMIKARVVAGDQEAGETLMSMLRPFVYRRYLDFGAIESLRNMKKLIDRELRRKGMSENVKLGPGGIREIEFIGQAFQLIRGGRDPELQIRPILPVLALLGERGQLPEYVVKELTEAYSFLRLVENRIQAWQDRQTHLLPEDDLGRLRLARSMGFDGWETFFAELSRHRGRVQGHFDKVFATPHTEGEAEEQPSAAIWDGSAVGEQAVMVLEEMGFRHGEEVLDLLDRFRGSGRFRSLGTKGQERLNQLMPLLLEAIGGTANPEQTLERILKLLEGIARRTSYLALLLETPLALSQLVRLTSISPWIAEQVTRYPLLLDEMLDPRRLYSPLRREALEQELTTLLSGVDEDDLEQLMERLRQFARSCKLRVAAADITGVIPLMVVSDYLTDIAETCVARALGQAWGDLVSRYGAPTDFTGSDTGFAVIGYGKLGGIELGYASDLDLVFIHGNSNLSAVTSGDRPIGNDVFYVRLGQRMIHIFTTRTPSGILYEIDMRLRPNGNSGILATSLDAFDRYQHTDAWTWEHQALLRARPVAGDPLLIEQFQTIRRSVLSRARDPDRLRTEVTEMREKMRVSLEKSKAGLFDLKQGKGGIADIEFMVQYLVLRWANKHPDLLEWTDNIRLLEGLNRHRLLEGDEVSLMTDSYKELRAAYHRNTLGGHPGVVATSELVSEREAVAQLWRHLMLQSGG